MPTHPKEPDRAASDPAEPAPEAERSPHGDVPPPDPAPRPEAAHDASEPDTAGPAPADDEYATAVQELEDRWRRALADLDNLRKRHARELERERAAERSRTAAAFLPVIDNLELALNHADTAPGAIVEGIRAVRDQAVNVLELLGYPRHAETGVAFDPARHEVVGVVQDPDAPPGTVVEVLRSGYGDDATQLRPAAVTVAKRE
ncbi:MULTISPECIES: nucleotide exchange factor GrpE [Streptomyces]|uniref:nucleotide exchange factor GrpE n=1 Tax=Streptomyces TaxID=1883 RepID=UPI001CCDF8A3|nr:MULTISPECIES: nucleotide exchange factor GrpE [Streptomyces]MBZ6139510.1 nucleotide exchange factor GrpE [Streptomyces olivaceus]MBZ6167078.1 nucleotide exchange factor GrpE [Streptomyces olivaceus]MBZ6173667.1 nucleotide exchange factor GrpE [Streptomyces olivaceus]MBZ6179844.1 nucleotide exchange factor GrpE [Streptomyces olivaceus]WFB87154.1 nucleotide exchange factor GrpE [Streptomyces olivaceus]